MTVLVISSVTHLFLPESSCCDHLQINRLGKGQWLIKQQGPCEKMVPMLVGFDV